MSNRYRSQRYRKPDDKEVKKIFFLQYDLEELFYEEQILDFMSIARQGVAGEFYFAKEENPRWRPGSNKKRFRGTDNYIIGVGNRPSDLARYVAEKTHRQIISGKQLPSRLRDLPPKLIDRIVANLRYQAVLSAVNVMVTGGELWYDMGLGTWNVSQSSVDGFLEDRSFRKAAKRAIKDDYRPWHGRPSRDRGQMPEGVSVSFA